jgi:hypothetical protein
MKLTTTTQVSVDGVMQGNGGPDENRSGGFERGGWARPPKPLFDNEAMTFVHEVYQRADAFLFGARAAARRRRARPRRAHVGRAPQPPVLHSPPTGAQSSSDRFLHERADLRLFGRVNCFSANAVGHMSPSSRFALSSKPSVAYLDLNFCALWK